MPADRIPADDLLKAAVENYRFGYDAETHTYALEHRVMRYVMRVSPEAAESPEVAALVARLGVRPSQASYDIDSAEAPEAPPATAVMVKMRSMLSTMVYLSRGVDIPETDPLRSFLGSNSLDEISCHELREATERCAGRGAVSWAVVSQRRMTWSRDARSGCCLLFFVWKLVRAARRTFRC